VVTKHLEQLCEKEFALKQDEAYKGFGRELARPMALVRIGLEIAGSFRLSAVTCAGPIRFYPHHTN